MNAPREVAHDANLEQAIADLDAGDLVAAAKAAASLLAERPDDHQVLRFAAALALVEKRFADSEKLLNRALENAPTPRDKAPLWAAHGELAKAIDNAEYAEESYRRAALADPSDMEHLVRFADVLAVRGKIELAIDLMRETMVRHPQDPRPCVALGNILLKTGRQRDALAIYDIALRRDPNSADAHFNAGVALTMLGELEGARTATQNALKLDPYMTGYYQLASLGALKTDDPAITHLESMLDDAKASTEARIDAGFALARAFDDAGDTGRAFPALVKANGLKRATLSYDIGVDEMRIDRIAALFSKDFFSRFAGMSDSKLAPIFIFGMPRSGTTLVEQMLAGHRDVEAGGEQSAMVDTARWIGEAWGKRGEAAPGTDEQVRADIRNIVAMYTQATARLQGRKAHFTDKLPGNFMFLGLIHLMFPEARLIHCKRDPVDTSLSCYQRLFSSDVPYSYDLMELGQYYRLYERLMQHWHTVLPPGRILDVEYESLVADPEGGLRRISAFCGLEYQASCLDFQNVKRSVTTASAVQVRKPLYKTSVQRWKKYGSQLNPLLRALGREPIDG